MPPKAASKAELRAKFIAKKASLRKQRLPGNTKTADDVKQEQENQMKDQFRSMAGGMSLDAFNANIETVQAKYGKKVADIMREVRKEKYEQKL